MNDLILHHYPGSPFSEKVRLILGYKQLAWRSVHIPVVMPKPDLLALTGGYRRTPVLQVGADVYCDTALIARVIDRLNPEPPIYPGDSAGTADLLAMWADTTLFWTAIAYTMQPAGAAEVFRGTPPEALKAFAADRATFAPNIRRPTPADAAAALRQSLAWLEQHLQAQAARGRGGDGDRGGPHMAGSQCSMADFAVAHPLWFVLRAPSLAAVLDDHPLVTGWLRHMLALGHGRPMRMSSAEALAVAHEVAAAGRHAPVSVQAGQGFEPGDSVTVTPLDYGCDPSPGRLVGLHDMSVTLERVDEVAGCVHVHFPRMHYQIRKASSP
jgi:glutathione S-transferase